MGFASAKAPLGAVCKMRMDQHIFALSEDDMELRGLQANHTACELDLYIVHLELVFGPTWET